MYSPFGKEAKKQNFDSPSNRVPLTNIPFEGIISEDWFHFPSFFDDTRFRSGRC